MNVHNPSAEGHRGPPASAAKLNGGTDSSDRASRVVARPAGAPAGAAGETAREAQKELPAVVNAEGVAALLGYRTANSFLTRRRVLEAAHGFPRKLPGLNGWSRAAVLRWVATNGETYLPADLDDGVRIGGSGMGELARQLEEDYS